MASTTPDRHAVAGHRIEAVLCEHAALVRAVLERHLARQEQRPWLGPLVADYPRRGGRHLGPGLCLLAVRVCGGQLEDALGPAAALELSHQAFLIQSDLVDDRRWRQGLPTLQRIHQMPLALNASDALSLLSLRPLLESQRRLGPRLSLQVLDEIEHMVEQTIRGWATELGWRRDGVIDFGLRAYLDMVFGRNCWPRILGPLRLGALIARRPIHFDNLTRFAFFFGAALQILDEVTDLGSGTETGLEGGQRTLPLLLLARRGGSRVQRRLSELLTTPPHEASDLTWIRERMIERGCLASAQAIALGLAEAARSEAVQWVRKLPVTGRENAFCELVDWLVLELRSVDGIR